MADTVDLAERFIYLDVVQMIRRDGVGTLESLSGRPAKKATAEELRTLAMIDWTPALRNSNRWYDRMVAALRLKNRADQQKALDKIEADLKRLKTEAMRPVNIAKFFLGNRSESGKAIGDMLIGLFLPITITHKVQDAHDQVEQTQRNLHVAFALAAYQRDNGRYPAKLDDLAPKYLARVPGDIFSGKALIYRPAKKGYLLYSVGVNGKDEGGRWYDDDPPGDDPSVRMPLPPLKPAKK
jgi:hypothetical protein